MIRKNSVPLGALLGAIGPVAGFWIYYILKYRSFNPSSLLDKVIELRMTSAVLSLSLLTNLGIFFLFIYFRQDYSARGVLLATILYAITGFLLKFLL
jgi:hypothetical protein